MPRGQGTHALTFTRRRTDADTPSDARGRQVPDDLDPVPLQADFSILTVREISVAARAGVDASASIRIPWVELERTSVEPTHRDFFTVPSGGAELAQWSGDWEVRAVKNTRTSLRVLVGKVDHGG